MDMTFTNKAMQAMSAFAIQLNKNSFGLVPSAQIQVGTLQPSQTIESSLVLAATGSVQRMEPLNNLQVSIFTLSADYAIVLIHTRDTESVYPNIDNEYLLGNESCSCSFIFISILLSSLTSFLSYHVCFGNMKCACVV